MQRNGRVVGVEVETGDRQGRVVEVTGNLVEGEEVVIGASASWTGQEVGLIGRGLLGPIGLTGRGG
jgi:hypothetical protein